MRLVTWMMGFLFAGQVTAAPPMRMGLWETTSVTTTTYPASMAAMGKTAFGQSGVPVTTTDKTCFSIEKWQQAVGLESPSSKCTQSKRDITAKEISLTLTCNFGGGVVMVSDLHQFFDSTETLHGTAHAVSTFPANMGGGGTVTTDSKTTGKFVSTDCGSVQPGKPLGAPSK
jgi:hypothetical protein